MSSSSSSSSSSTARSAWLRHLLVILLPCLMIGTSALLQYRRDAALVESELRGLAEITAIQNSLEPALASGQSDVAFQAALDNINLIGDQSGLVLDPELDSYYLMQSLVLSYPLELAALRQKQSSNRQFLEGFRQAAKYDAGNRGDHPDEAAATATALQNYLAAKTPAQRLQQLPELRRQGSLWLTAILQRRGEQMRNQTGLIFALTLLILATGLVLLRRQMRRDRQDRDKLQQALRQAQEAEQLTSRQAWLKTGISRLNDQISGNPDLVTLAAKILVECASYLDAKIGTLYISADDGSLLLTGTYACRPDAPPPARLLPGQSLIGQAALEKKPLLLQPPPSDCQPVNSSLASLPPSCLFISPFLYEGKVMGVIELGCLQALDELQQLYLSEVMDTIALAVDSAENRQRLALSLRESQELTEKLQLQQEELRTMNEELEEQAKTLRLSEEKLRVQQEELQVTNEELTEKNLLLDQQRQEVEKSSRIVEEKARDLAQASKYKSEFLANMSHELRTPLNSLLLLAQSLSENRSGNLSAEQLECIKIIYGGGNDLLSLINEILDLSKIEAGRMDLALSRVAVSELASAARSSFAHVAAKKGLNLTIDIDEDCPAELLSDRKRIEQVIKNLLSNAIKFTEQGQVSLRFGRPPPGTAFNHPGLKAAECLAIAVKDSGLGIAEANQKLVFEAFKQVDGGSARRFGGTGLGLSISRQLAQLLGGEIQLRSELGKGAEFTLFLPLAVDASPKTSPVRVPPSPGRAASAPAPSSPPPIVSRSLPKGVPIVPPLSPLQIDDDRAVLLPGEHPILVIEDDSSFARLLRDKCHDRGLKCLAAPSAEDGLELALRFQPAAIILDIHLPGMDGWSLLQILKDNPAVRHIPVHIISSDDTGATAAIQLGAIGCATKPISQDELETAFRKLENVHAHPLKRLLVIDDDALLRQATVTLLGGPDVAIDEAADGQAALTALRRGGYDCVILDLSLPDFDGCALLDRLEAEKLPLPPVIIYTAQDLDPQQEAQLREHAESIVLKDVRSQERLLDEVSLFLHRLVSQIPEKNRQIILDLHDSDTLLRGKKVLIVDDDMRTTFAMARFLADRGMIALKADNGEKALKILADNPDVDLVLMDIMMPIVDGYEAMRRIRAQERFRKLPIICLTAKAMPEDRDKCLAAGANDYLPKPVDKQRLISLMRVWLYR